MGSILTVWILLFSISFTIAVQLDGTCANNAQCDGNTLICEGQKCRCRPPFYKPCKSACEITRHYAYEGEQCEMTDNCAGYANCTETKCRCMAGYTNKNGLCFKILNATCSNGAECWSEYCLNSRCTCTTGYNPRPDQFSCELKLVKVYENWSDALAAKEFCSGDDSCWDIVAKCVVGVQNSNEKFCKCPTAHNATNENKKCEPQKSSLLSPLDVEPTNNSYDLCAVCDDNRAACIKAGNETTCWCRSGYTKEGKKCGKYAKSLVIFPNANDVNHHDFTSGCKDKFNISNGLCGCSPHYKFVAKDQPCAKIEPKWIDNVYEYGLCTRIDSRDQATGENGLCAEQLKCEARRDKHVCSCGKDKFLNLDNLTQCVYYIGKAATSTSECPNNARRNETNGMCECLLGYKATDENRRCAIELSSASYQSLVCSSDRTLDIICNTPFGKKAMFCTVGECRCSGNQSLANSGRTHCYAPVDQALDSPQEDCPPDSSLDGNRCKCNSGYTPSNDFRSCVSIQVQLIEYAGPPINQNNLLTTADCKALFKGPVEAYSSGSCQCKSDTRINDDKNGCWYRLNVQLPEPDETVFCPPYSDDGSKSECECRKGYASNDDKCVRVLNRVFDDNDANVETLNDLTESICVHFFGLGATKSTKGNYCICRSSAYRLEDNSYCHFLINEKGDAKSNGSCPANATLIGPPDECICLKGFYVSSDRRYCETTSITLAGTLNVNASQSTNCLNFANSDCTVKYGEQAFCQNETCYCNRDLSYVNADNKCELFSNYIFPSAHELNIYSCITNDDCDKRANVECGYLNQKSEYKVCKCKEGSLLDPKSQTCVEGRCIDGCNTRPNSECRDYECVCKNGYYLNNGVCTVNSNKYQLDERCNASNLWEIENIATTEDSLECDVSCDRIRCKLGYQSNGSRCARSELDGRCFYRPDICQQLDANAMCYKDENRCLCKPSFYEDEEKCVRAIGAECSSDEECGGGMTCKTQRCACTDVQHPENIDDDVYGHPMQRCVDNGMNRIGFSPVLLLFFVLVRGLFT